MLILLEFRVATARSNKVHPHLQIHIPHHTLQRFSLNVWRTTQIDIQLVLGTLRMVSGPPNKLPLYQRNSGTPYYSEWTTLLHLSQSCMHIHQYSIGNPFLSIPAFTHYTDLNFVLLLPLLPTIFASYILLTTLSSSILWT
jgi:hypothetical protein